MKRLLLAASFGSGLLLQAGAARACGLEELPLALMHSALPSPLPAGAIIAEVEAGPGAPDLLRGISVRVRRMIQGEPAPILILRLGRVHSCMGLFVNGRAGFIIAIPAGTSDGVPVVNPIFAHRRDGFRLPDGYRLPRP